MIDAILSLSRRTCSWCHYKPTDPVARFLGADRLGGPRGWRRVGWWLYNDLSYRLGLWRLGQRFHHAHHHVVTTVTVEQGTESGTLAP